MRLRNLSVSNYRNYEKLELCFSDKKNVFLIIGRNAQGKSNILEAIYFLALCKSFRQIPSKDLIKWGEDFFRICADIEKDTEDINLEIVNLMKPKNKKAHKVNGVKKSVTDFIGTLNITFFSPDDINMIILSPSYRRRYFDVILSQIDKRYLQNIIKYKKVIQNRNQILKNINRNNAEIDELYFWDQKFIDISYNIVQKRREMIQYYNTYLKDYYSTISNSSSVLELKYKSNIKNLEKDLIQLELKNRLEVDIRLESTLLGPHRDDIEFYLDDNEMCYSSSRGEIRSAILSLKMIEIQFFKDQTGYNPVLLLDDAFSELDKERKNKLLQIVNDNQTIITSTTDNMDILSKLGDKVIWCCEEGKIKNMY